MTSKGPGGARVRPRSERRANEDRNRAEEDARRAEEEAERLRREAESVEPDFGEYLRDADKEKITFNLTSDIAEAIRDHSRPLRMTHSEIVERGVRMFFRSQLIDVPGPGVE